MVLRGCCYGKPQEYEREWDIVELLRELETSKGRWNIFEAKVMSAHSRPNARFKATKLLKAGLKRRKPAKKQKKALWDSDDETEVCS